MKLKLFCPKCGGRNTKLKKVDNGNIDVLLECVDCGKDTKFHIIEVEE